METPFRPEVDLLIEVSRRGDEFKEEETDEETIRAVMDGRIPVDEVPRLRGFTR